jgi:hypothetical protein
MACSVKNSGDVRPVQVRSWIASDLGEPRNWRIGDQLMLTNRFLQSVLVTAD